MKQKNQKDSRIPDPQGWNKYWASRETVGFWAKVYGLVAEFYRKFIIRPNLNRFVKKYFDREEKLLHAGCGSGQVDREIRRYVHITGMDISPNALGIFLKENGEFCDAFEGSIFDIPVKNTYDGIYNLGVMEHFTLEEIDKIFSQYRKALKENGRVLLFWPPEFGLSVIFFKILKKILSPFLGPNLSFHPVEISRLKSKAQASQILEKNGFRLIEYYFGIRDLFTYSVIVAEPVPKKNKP